MQQDELKIKVDKIKNWCIENNFVVFFGSVEKIELTEITWTISQENNWEKYLETAKRMGVNSIILDFNVNDFDAGSDEVIEYTSSLDKDVLKEFDKILKTVVNKNGHITDFNIVFISSGVAYKYTEEADWIEEYNLLEEFIYLNNEDEEEDDDENSRLVYERLSDQEIEDYSRKIIANKDYQTLLTPPQKRALNESLIREMNLSDSKWSISSRINEIYEQEIRPKIESETKKKVLSLKKQGMKKVQIASKLNIGKSIVDKFFDSE